MATEEKQTNGTNGAKKKSKSGVRIAIFVVEIVIILAMLLVVYKVFQTTEESEGPHFVEIQESEISINSEVVENEQMKGYWNIALFGVDATKPDQLYKNSRSDSMMIASINLDNGEVKIVSVYRDTYLNIGNDNYRKCNTAYAAGGAQQAIEMLNTNLDMNITDFVTVGYSALMDCIDGLGGVWIEVDESEIKHINNYQKTISKDVLNDRPYTEVTKTGYQLLDGLQATAYCRIRYTKGDDFKRAERQREVLQAIEDEAKKADLNTLTKVFTNVIDNVYTSISKEDMLSYIGMIADYSIVDEGGFPHVDYRTTGEIGSKGSCVIPVDLRTNVEWLHGFLFESEEYTVSTTVKDFSEKIKEETSPYLDLR